MLPAPVIRATIEATKNLVNGYSSMGHWEGDRDNTILYDMGTCLDGMLTTLDKVNQTEQWVYHAPESASSVTTFLRTDLSVQKTVNACLRAEIDKLRADLQREKRRRVKAETERGRLLEYYAQRGLAAEGFVFKDPNLMHQIRGLTKELAAAKIRIQELEASELKREESDTSDDEALVLTKDVYTRYDDGAAQKLSVAEQKVAEQSAALAEQSAALAKEVQLRQNQEKLCAKKDRQIATCRAETLKAEEYLQDMQQAAKKELKNVKRELHQKIDMLQVENGALISRNKSLEGHLMELQEEVTILRSTVASKATEIDVLVTKQSCVDEIQKIATLEHERVVGEKNKLITKLEREAETYRLAIEAIEDKMEAAEEKMTLIKKSENDMKSRLAKQMVTYGRFLKDSIAHMNKLTIMVNAFYGLFGHRMAEVSYCEAEIQEWINLYIARIDRIRRDSKEK